MGLGSGIRDSGSGKNLFWIPDPGVKIHRIPDPDPQQWFSLSYFKQCCGSGSGIRCLSDPLDSGSGMGKKSGSYFREHRNNFWGVLIIKFFDADPGW
jgi:hypothetical protein